MIQQTKSYPLTGHRLSSWRCTPWAHTAHSSHSTERLHAGEETRVRTSSLPQRTAHPGRALVAAVRPQSRPSRPQALHHLVTSPRIKPLLQLSSTTTQQQEEARAIESSARVDSAAALFHRPITALHHTSAACRHHSDLNRCRFISQTAAAHRMTMRSFVLPPSCWRGWAGPS